MISCADEFPQHIALPPGSLDDALDLFEAHRIRAEINDQRFSGNTIFLGLTATPIRKDGHHPIILMQCGPIRFNLSAKKLGATQTFDHLVTPRFTHFSVPPEWSEISIQVAEFIRHQQTRARLQRLKRKLTEVFHPGDSAKKVLFMSRENHFQSP